MLTFHHSFSTRIFPDWATEPRLPARSVTLSRAKDPRNGRSSSWILRTAQEDRLRDITAEHPAAKGGAHAR